MEEVGLGFQEKSGRFFESMFGVDRACSTPEKIKRMKSEPRGCWDVWAFVLSRSAHSSPLSI